MQSNTPPCSILHLSPLAPRRPRAFVSAALAATLATLGGCVIDEEGDESGEAPVELERRGIAFEQLDVLVDEVPEPDQALVLPRAPVEGDADLARPLAERSREDLADSLRPVIATQGHTYVASEPNWAAADAILGGDLTSRGVDFVPRPDGERGEASPLDPDGTQFRQIIGSDGRTMPWPTNTPYNAIARIDMYTGDMYRGSCSGSYIGPWTFITSAHCMVYSDVDRADRVVFQPARTGDYYPYGSFDCRLDDADGANDFLWSVPYGYLYGQDGALDYAVMDTWPCHQAPAWFGGYQTNAGNDTYSTYGYPGDTCPGAPAPGKFMCGMTGPANLNDWRIETEHIDTMPGQSGSPWWRTYDIDRPVGVLWGYREYFDLFQCGFDVCRRNFARRIDNAFSQFIVDVAWDY